MTPTKNYNYKCSVKWSSASVKPSVHQFLCSSPAYPSCMSFWPGETRPLMASASLDKTSVNVTQSASPYLIFSYPRSVEMKHNQKTQWSQTVLSHSGRTLQSCNWRKVMIIKLLSLYLDHLSETILVNVLSECHCCLIILLINGFDMDTSFK